MRSHTFFTARHNVNNTRERYLHDEEKEEDDEDANVWMEPHRGATQAGRRRVPCDFGPGEIIKQGVDTLPGHQLPEKKQKQQTASHSSEQESIQNSAQSQKGPAGVSVQKESENHLLKNPRIHINVHSVFIFLTFIICLFPSSFFNSFFGNFFHTCSVLVFFCAKFLCLND